MTVLKAAQVTSLASQAGFAGADLSIAVAIAYAESRFKTDNINYDNNGTVDRGLWQINSVNGYDPVLLLSSPQYNAAAAFKIYTARGRKFTDWTTYNSGVYRAYLSLAGSSNNTNGVSQKVQSGTSNGYPPGQCTWWADERYHRLTGYYVPWSGNAKDWSSMAAAAGWTVSSSPHVPSIVVIQPNVQGADPTFGHVAIAEKMNADGSVYTSSQNVHGVPLVNGVGYINYKAGNGVTFVWAGSGTQPQGVPVSAQSGGANANQSSWIPMLQQVHNTLVEAPGFYGIAAALDELEQYPGWVDLTSPNDPTLLGFDVYGWTRSIGASIASNGIPLAIRSGMMILGFLIILFLLMRVIFGIGEAGLNVAEKVAPLAALAA